MNVDDNKVLRRIDRFFECTIAAGAIQRLLMRLPLFPLFMDGG